MAINHKGDVTTKQGIKALNWWQSGNDSLSQPPHDRILWILGNNGGKMEQSGLRARIGMRYAMLNAEPHHRRAGQGRQD